MSILEAPPIYAIPVINQETELSLGTTNLYYEEVEETVAFDVEDEDRNVILSTTTIDEGKKLAIPRKDVAFVQLPPLPQHPILSPAQEEFRAKIAYFERFSERDMALLASKRLRVVLEGMAASPLEPAVYRAFEILYQDLVPLRLAGRLIFRRLEHVLTMVVEARTLELELLLQNNQTTLINQSTLQDAQFAFLVLIELSSDPTRVDDAGIHNDREHDLILPMQHFLQSSSWWLEEETHEQPLEALFDPDQTDSLDFPQFVQGLQRFCQQDKNAQTLEEFLQQVTHKILTVAALEEEDSSRRHRRVLDPKRQSYSDRFDQMLTAVRAWKTLDVTGGGGRKWDVLRGCWVGAENEAVREALRIVYVDHPALRVAGNTIFALVSALI